jgi:methylenetetrahydrofolate reductase (NADPH)
MFAKAPMATNIVSQVCFDPETIATWVRAVRARGTALPIWVGVPGCVDYAKLVRISMRIGLGESARFLGAHRSWMRRLVAREFRPDPVVAGLRDVLADPRAGVAGLHLYTFNEVGRTERWRQRRLRALTARTG